MNGPKGIMTNFEEEGGEKNKGQKRKLEESNGDGAENNENGNGVHNGLVLFRLLLKQIERVHFMEAKCKINFYGVYFYQGLQLP